MRNSGRVELTIFALFRRAFRMWALTSLGILLILLARERSLIQERAISGAAGSLLRATDGYQALIVSAALTEDRAGLNRLLAAVRERENLSRIAFVSVDDPAASQFKDCIDALGEKRLKLYVSPSCERYSGGTLETLQEILSAGVSLGALYKAKQVTLPALGLSRGTAYNFLAVCVLMGIFGLTFTYHLRRRLVSPIEQLSQQARSGNWADETDFSLVEIRRLAEALQEFVHARTVNEVATQVAHDIRSPLAALEVVSSDVAQLPEDKRILIRSAVGRIHDIANNLLDCQRTTAGGSRGASAEREAVSPQLLSSLIDPVVSEKRLQFRSSSRVEIELRLDATSYGLFAAVQPVELKRAVSNLVNNAVEAFGDAPGAVDVSLGARDGRALVSVRDNGRGIPPEVLARLGRRGETHGKASGSGLGLHHARTSAESWGGSLELASEVGKGTTATLALPLAPAPEWFVAELALTPGQTVVVLDDDASIHQVWQGRLDALKAQERGVKVVHVSTPEELRGWAKGDEAAARRALCLFDYELLGHKETGLSLAGELGLGERVVLVTSRYEEPEVLEGCRRLKARLIPKGLAGMVPLRMEDPAPPPSPDAQRLDAVLIDDDPLTRMVWENVAAAHGKRLRAFSSPAEFFREAGGFPRETPIYVDSHLGEGLEGAEVSRRIFALGFGEVYLETGYEPERFAGFGHLRGVIGKTPPWGATG